ncbi:MAG: hypothetical protein ABL927_05210, partial [Bdellovibrionales bacterium]
AESRGASIFGVLFFIFILWGARKVADHFSFHHTHEGDSEVDKSISATLFTVNILHPMVDGFALYGIYNSLNSGVFFTSVLVGIVVHEIFRQAALVVVFKGFGFKARKVILPAILGMALGVFLGMVGGVMPSWLEPYIDVLTFGAYTFIVAEHLFAHKEVFKKRNLIFALIAGVLVATIFVAFFKAH